MLNAGGQTLTTTFIPNDLVNYASASMSVTLQVDRAPLSAVANDKQRAYGVANPEFDGVLAELILGDNITGDYHRRN